MTDTTIAPDVHADDDKRAADAFRKLSAGLRQTAVALARMADGRGFAEMREATVGLIESAEAADFLGAEIDRYAVADTGGDDNEGTPG